MSFKVIQSLFLILNSRYFWVDSIPYVHYFPEGCTSNNCSLRYQRVSIKKKKYHVNKQCSIMIFEINNKSESERGITAKKASVHRTETKIEFTENATFYKLLPMFCVRKIQRFPCVFASVNPSIRSIIR